MKKFLSKLASLVFGGCSLWGTPPNAPHPMPQIVIPLEPEPGKYTTIDARPVENPEP